MLLCLSYSTKGRLFSYQAQHATSFEYNVEEDMHRSVNKALKCLWVIEVDTYMASESMNM